VVISHDRWFLDRIATHMLAFEGDSQVVWFEGNYEDYEPIVIAAWAVMRTIRIASNIKNCLDKSVMPAGKRAYSCQFRATAYFKKSWINLTV